MNWLREVRWHEVPARGKHAATRTWELISETMEQFSRDRVDLAAAGLAFFTLLSLAPLIIIAVAVAGFFLGERAAQREVDRLLADTMGSTAAEAVGDWVRQAADARGVASLIGTGLLLFTASRLANQLRESLNHVWNVDVAQAEGFKSSVKAYVARRLYALAVVLAAGPLLLFVFLSRAVLTALQSLFDGLPLWDGAGLQLIQFVFSLLVVAMTTALVFRYVPDTRIGWRAVWVGAGVTSLLFNLGNVLIGLYLGKATVAEAYGAAGSAVVVLLWLYYSAQMFLLGAEFTQVYARHYGSGLTPDEREELRRARAQARRVQSPQRG